MPFKTINITSNTIGMTSETLWMTSEMVNMTLVGPNYDLGSPKYDLGGANYDLGGAKYDLGGGLEDLGGVPEDFGGGSDHLKGKRVVGFSVMQVIHNSSFIIHNSKQLSVVRCQFFPTFYDRILKDLTGFENLFRSVYQCFVVGFSVIQGIHNSKFIIHHSRQPLTYKISKSILN